jgi:N-acetylglucosamine malate deacetylase 1
VTTLFLFAHQDDEVGVCHEITSTLVRGDRAICVYLTNGAWKDVTPEIRNAETSEVLQRVGVAAADVHFLGTEFSIPGSALPDNLDKCWNALVGRVAQIGGITRIVMHAWEGGHHDHDAVHLLGVALAQKLNVLEASRQFPLYRAPGGRVLVTYGAPLAANGPVTRSRIPWAKRFQYISYLRFYRSQLTTVLKVGPLIAWDYLKDGCQKLQPVSLARIAERPNSGTLLYEIWQLYSYETFSHNVAAFISRHEEFGHGQPSLSRSA